MLRAMISILLLIILAVGTVLLEIYLAKKPSRWPGLVLPFMFFLFSFIYPLSAVNFGDFTEAIIAAVFSWLAANIPTVVMLAIYFASRRRTSVSRARRKMDAQDLG